jgi:hypothetical protein
MINNGIDKGSDYHRRLYVKYKAMILELLEGREMRSIELVADINAIVEDREKCNLNQVVAALSALEFDGLVLSRGWQGEARYWRKTPINIRGAMARSGGALKVYRIEDLKDG